MTGKLGSPSRFVTGSQFAKRFALFAIVPNLYAMTMFNKGMHISLQNCQLETDQPSDWLSHVRLIPMQISQPISEQGRAAWRDALIKSMFVDQLEPLWQSLSASARIPMELLWENTAVRLFSLYERRIGAERTELQQRRIEQDYHYLVHEAPGVLFGQSQNPLTKFYKPITVEQPVRIRKTCCFYYEVSADREYCSTCPNKKRG
ncbi:hypothetical protein BEP19_13965 [Ammoniphilus oxalaticus]|uniref:Ferric siderophore reductase C-terminal domain-containing protein n=1 Tax=Ammoniphilus oxalaticus TaxID=66863 RepID=A0A419SFC1_9BACL|nr:hypothetical protein BEP19_13965 [Ammoniphilus oxalaticus]